jgi:hypothetical protein
MCTLAMQAGKLTARPYIPLLKESNIRRGFFEPEQFASVKNHRPVHLQPIVGSYTSPVGGRRSTLGHLSPSTTCCSGIRTIYRHSVTAPFRS